MSYRERINDILVEDGHKHVDHADAQDKHHAQDKAGLQVKVVLWPNKRQQLLHLDHKVGERRLSSFCRGNCGSGCEGRRRPLRVLRVGSALIAIDRRVLCLCRRPPRHAPQCDRDCRDGEDGARKRHAQLSNRSRGREIARRNDGKLERGAARPQDPKNKQRPRRTLLGAERLAIDNAEEPAKSDEPLRNVIDRRVCCSYILIERHHKGQRKEH